MMEWIGSGLKKLSGALSGLTGANAKLLGGVIGIPKALVGVVAAGCAFTGVKVCHNNHVNSNFSKQPALVCLSENVKLSEAKNAGSSAKKREKESKPSKKALKTDGQPGDESKVRRGAGSKLKKDVKADKPSLHRERSNRLKSVAQKNDKNKPRNSFSNDADLTPGKRTNLQNRLKNMKFEPAANGLFYDKPDIFYDRFGKNRTEQNNINQKSKLSNLEKGQYEKELKELKNKFKLKFKKLSDQIKSLKKEKKQAGQKERLKKASNAKQKKRLSKTATKLSTKAERKLKDGQNKGKSEKPAHRKKGFGGTKKAPKRRLEKEKNEELFKLNSAFSNLEKLFKKSAKLDDLAEKAKIRKLKNLIELKKQLLKNQCLKKPDLKQTKAKEPAELNVWPFNLEQQTPKVEVEAKKLEKGKKTKSSAQRLAKVAPSLVKVKNADCERKQKAEKQNKTKQEPDCDLISASANEEKSAESEPGGVDLATYLAMDSEFISKVKEAFNSGVNELTINKFKYVLEKDETDGLIKCFCQNLETDEKAAAAIGCYDFSKIVEFDGWLWVKLTESILGILLKEDGSMAEGRVLFDLGQVGLEFFDDSGRGAEEKAEEVDEHSKSCVEFGQRHTNLNENADEHNKSCIEMGQRSTNLNEHAAAGENADVHNKSCIESGQKSTNFSEHAAAGENVDVHNKSCIEFGQRGKNFSEHAAAGEEAFEHSKSCIESGQRSTNLNEHAAAGENADVHNKSCIESGQRSTNLNEHAAAGENADVHNKSCIEIGQKSTNLNEHAAAGENADVHNKSCIEIGQRHANLNENAVAGENADVHNKSRVESGQRSTNLNEHAAADENADEHNKLRVESGQRSTNLNENAGERNDLGGDEYSEEGDGRVLVFSDSGLNIEEADCQNNLAGSEVADFGGGSENQSLNLSENNGGLQNLHVSDDYYDELEGLNFDVDRIYDSMVKDKIFDCDDDLNFEVKLVSPADEQMLNGEDLNEALACCANLMCSVDSKKAGDKNEHIGDESTMQVTATDLTVAEKFNKTFSYGGVDENNDQILCDI